MTSLIRTLHRWRAWLWVVPAVPAVVITAVVMVVLPPDQTLDGPAELVFKLSPFVLSVAAIALLPRLRMAPALLLLTVFVYMAYLDTELVLRIQQYGRMVTTDDDAFQPVYQFELFVTTFVVLFGLLAFRLGGARTATVLKTGLAAVLVVISGLNDLTFWALNNVWSAGHRPATLPWASHMIVFVGRPPSIPVAVTFMIVHLVLAAIVAALPLGRWVDRRLAVEDRAAAPRGRHQAALRGPKFGWAGSSAALHARSRPRSRWSMVRSWVAHPVQAGFDAPAPADPAPRLRGAGLASVEAGDGAAGLHAPASVAAASVADECQSLSSPVPVAAAGQVDDPDGAGLDATMTD